MSESALTVRESNIMPIASPEDVEKLGIWLFETGSYGCKNKAQGCVLILNCQAERISPAEHNRRYHTIDGKQAIRSDYVLSRFMDLGGKVTWTRFDNQMASAKWTYGGSVDLQVSYSLEEAKAYGLVRPGSQWAKDSGAMCRARLIMRVMRMICPKAITGGGYSVEEMEDMRPISIPASSSAAMTEAPKTIAPEDVAVSPPPGAADAPPAPEVVPDAPADVVDVAIVPFGQAKGKRLDDRTVKYLLAFVNEAAGHPGVTQAHIDYAAKVLAAKQAKGEGAA